jgi:hypothetical protein
MLIPYRVLNIGINFKKRIKASLRSPSRRRSLFLTPVLLLLQGLQVIPESGSRENYVEDVMAAGAASVDPTERPGVPYWALVGEACALSCLDLQAMSVQGKPVCGNSEILGCFGHSLKITLYRRD